VNAGPEIGPVALDGFEVWDRSVCAPAGKGKKAAFVSIRVGGNIGLNKAAVEILGGPRAVRVMFDPKGRRLGFLPADPDAHDSYRLGDFQAQMACGKLFDYYGIEVKETVRCHDVEMVDGVLVVDIAEAEAAQ